MRSTTDLNKLFQIHAGLVESPCPVADLPGPCWLWTRRKNRNGYGRVYYDGKERQVHRVLYLLLRGPIPKGKILDHRCRVRACSNPDHLEPVTHQTNTLRGAATLFRPPSHYQGKCT